MHWHCVLHRALKLMEIQINRNREFALIVFSQLCYTWTNALHFKLTCTTIYLLLIIYFILSEEHLRIISHKLIMMSGGFMSPNNVAACSTWKGSRKVYEKWSIRLVLYLKQIYLKHTKKIFPIQSIAGILKWSLSIGRI